MGLIDRIFGRESPGAAVDRVMGGNVQSSANRLNDLTESEQRYFNPNVIPSNFAGFNSTSGVYVSERTALQELAVYSCVRLLADSVSALPQDVNRKQSGGVRIPLPLPVVVAQPNPNTTPFEHMQKVVASLALRGNSYEHVTAFDKFEYPLSRDVIHPDDVAVTRNQDDGRADYKIHGVKVPRSDMIHIGRFWLPGYLKALSPIEQARQGIGLSIAAGQYGATWFGDSANPSSVLETLNGANLSDEAAARTMAAWVASQGGRRHPAVLSGGLSYKQITITPEESQFLATRAFQRGEIAMMFGVPPHMIGDTTKSTSWGTGIEEQSLGFVRYTLLPWMRCIEDAYSWRLLPRGQYLKFNVDALLRGDTATRYAAYTQARQASWLNVDEIRELEDREPLPDGLGQSYIQPLNYAPLGSVPAL